jgi:uncharacterized membrane protein
MARGVWSVPTRYWLPVVFLAALPVAGNAQQEYRCVVLDSSPHLYGFAFGAGGGLIAGHGGPNTGVDRAFVWDASTGIRRDLHPEGYYISRAFCTDGATIGGASNSSETSREHATLWDPTKKTIVDLHPSATNLRDSRVNAVDRNEQIGTVGDFGGVAAALWRGTAESYVDLTPPGWSWTQGTGISAGRQVGFGGPPGLGGLHALLWRGSASTYEDINPTGYFYSQAFGISGDSVVGLARAQQVGYPHAALWNLRLKTFADIHPDRFDQSRAVETNGSQHVGWASLNGFQHALLWQGGNYVDLPLAPGIITAEATGIDANGYISGIGYDEARAYALAWQPVPESATFSTTTALIVLLWVLRNGSKKSPTV